MLGKLALALVLAVAAAIPVKPAHDQEAIQAKNAWTERLRHVAEQHAGETDIDEDDDDSVNEAGWRNTHSCDSSCDESCVRKGRRGRLSCDKSCDSSCDAGAPPPPSPPPPPPSPPPPSPSPPAPPAPLLQSGWSGSDEQLEQARLYALLAWGAYYPGNYPNNTARAGAENYYPCYGNTVEATADTDKGFVAYPDGFSRLTDCGPAVDGWEFQGHIEKNTLGSLGFGAAWADVYHKSTDKCLVAIAGTDDNGDIFVSDLSLRFTPIKDSNGDNTGYQMARGDIRYYESLQPYVKAACGDRYTIVTGHSLGGAATNVMRAMGDADESWAFAPPKAFKQFGISSYTGNVDPKCKRSSDEKMSNSVSFYTQDSTGNKDVVDPVPGSFSTRGMHCTNSHVQLLKPSNDPSEITDTVMADTDPGRVLWARSLPGVMAMHPMFTSYMPYLEALTGTAEDAFHPQSAKSSKSSKSSK